VSNAYAEALDDDYDEPGGYYGGDHEFESDVEPGTNKGHCAYVYFDTFEEWTDKGPRMVTRERVCGASWTSVLHPPDQFRHWCSALENGWDCMHFERDDE
jgi:hypothetical protein